MIAVVLHSGGLDSTTALYEARETGALAIALSINYGQRHRVELVHAAKICKDIGVEQIEVELNVGQFLVGSALTDRSVKMPEGHYQAASMASTVVPNRNMMMISIAGAICEARGGGGVWYAAHAGDHAIYPDCRPEFISLAGRTLMAATDGRVNLIAPFSGLSKANIAEFAARIGVPIEETWSCYKGGKVHCGRCSTCVERQEAFRDANVYDATEYKDPDYWKSATKESDPRG